MTLIRPLLNIKRHDLRDYLAACEQPVDDPTMTTRHLIELPCANYAPTDICRHFVDARVNGHTYAAPKMRWIIRQGMFSKTIGRQQGTDLIFDQAGFFAAHSETQNRLLSAGLC